MKTLLLKLASLALCLQSVAVIPSFQNRAVVVDLTVNQAKKCDYFFPAKGQKMSFNMEGSESKKSLTSCKDFLY